MCRKRYLHGCTLLALGIGLVVGQCLESWLTACGGGCALILLGLWVLGRRC